MVIPWEEYMKVKGIFALENDILYYEIKIRWTIRTPIWFTIPSMNFVLIEKNYNEIFFMQ